MALFDRKRCSSKPLSVLQTLQCICHTQRSCTWLHHTVLCCTAVQDADNLEDSPTVFIICSYQRLILELCIRSMKVSVHVTLRMTPNTERSARSGSSPPWNLQQHEHFSALKHELSISLTEIHAAPHSTPGTSETVAADGEHGFHA